MRIPWVCCLILILAGCAVADETDPEIEGVLPGVWQEVGPARLAEHAVVDAREYADEEAAPEPVVVKPHGDAIVIRAVDVEKKIEYRVTISPAEMDDGTLSDELAAGYFPGSDPPGELEDTPVATGWSDDDDSRIRISNTTSWPYRAIGSLFDGGGDCTGTRIGPRHVLTAAHCIYNKSSQSWNTIEFKPGRNGTSSAPYGSAGAQWYWIPEEYIDSPSGGSAINGWDIGLIILDQRVGDGWMGYGAWTGNVLEQKNLYMRGYPRCNTTGAPAGCQPKTLWGDLARCELGTFFDEDDDGWNRQIKTNCDGSAGQSGSSFYFYNQKGVPVTIGVFSHHYCLGGCPDSANNEWPNVLTRITPTYLDVINAFRAAYPD